MNLSSLGYVTLHVNDVAANFAFHEKALVCIHRFFQGDNDNTYGELETGATRLAKPACHAETQ